MKNNIIVFIIIIVLLMGAIIVLGIVLNNTKNKLDKSNNQLTLYQTTSDNMRDDAMALMKIGQPDEPISQSQLNCLNNIADPQQLWSGLIIRTCGDSNVLSHPQGKVICSKYGDMYDNV